MPVDPKFKKLSLVCKLEHLDQTRKLLRPVSLNCPCNTSTLAQSHCRVFESFTILLLCTV